MSQNPPDVIDQLVGTQAGSPLDQVRQHRQQARINAQQSYLALFAPAEPGRFSLADRFALATFVAGLHRQPAIADFYAAGLAEQQPAPTLSPAIGQAVTQGLTEGPYGEFPAGPHSSEDKDGLVYTVADELRTTLGKPLAAAFDHAHVLVFHPRDDRPAHLQALLDAGWSTTEIVTLSQLVAFLSFQIRVVVGLRALSASPAPASSNTTGVPA